MNNAFMMLGVLGMLGAMNQPRVRRSFSKPPGTRRKDRARRKAERQRKKK